MPNHLDKELSPYLLQHRLNPVDWHPWGPEAFEKARKEDKPIFLSIGYATCHWCHVMEHESFEDEEVAALMNDVFVSIKVDREERPDIDQIYMLYCQLSTRQGGWPLTIVMTPAGEPFFSATYLPKQSRFGRVGMMELVPHIKKLWENSREEILASAAQNVQILQEAGNWETSASGVSVGVLDLAFQQLLQSYDPEYGGFGDAPKFPSPHQLQFLLQYAQRSGNSAAIDMAAHTLQHMRLGGIFDHVGFGFHRYATDRTWLLPHFEKMLYDQAMIAQAAVDAFQVTGEAAFREIAEKIFTYVLRDMTDTAGGFYSAEDADSEGVEGKFYVWSMAEIEEVLGPDQAGLFAEVFNFEKRGNFREESTHKYTGENIPFLKQPLNQVVEKLAGRRGLPPAELAEKIAAAREILFTHREARIQPGKDDKILTDWNGLMIAALSKGGRILGEQRYVEAASAGAQFIASKLTEEGDRARLLHRYRMGDAGLQANLDDYAFLMHGLLALYEATFDVAHLVWTIELCDQMLARFWDEEAGGFYFTPSDGEVLIARQKDAYDDAIPSGNAVALQCLLRLGRITGKPVYEEKAAALVNAFAHPMNRHPGGFCALLSGIDFAQGPAYEIVLVGDPDEPDAAALLSEINRVYLPNSVILCKKPGQAAALEAVAPYTGEMQAPNGKAAVYVCENFQCNQPVADVEALRVVLGVN